jgi:hypothetical protein
MEASRVSRYRKVEVKTYGDEKFRMLSPIPPSGQGLWLYLITGPHTNAIPGLFRAGRAALAEELGWLLEDFEKAFAEIVTQGMAKADWTNRVVWIPNAVKHNKPASPNVITSWASELELIPECDLKAEAIRGIGETLSALSPAYSRAFEALGNPWRKPSPKPSPKQEQEQEQEQQEQEETKTFALIAPALPASAPFLTLPLNDGTEYAIGEQQVVEWQSLYPAGDVRQELRNYKGWAIANPAKRKTRRGILASVNTWLARSHDNSGNNRNGGNNGINRAQQRTNGNVESARRALGRLDCVAGGPG